MLVAQRFMRPNTEHSQPPRAREPGMSKQQAVATLGLEDTPVDATTVINAHRRLMQRVHPDKGGSAALAQQLNEAKRVLLIDS